MNHNKHFAFFIGIIAMSFLFTACLSLDLKDLKPYPKNANLLPTLEPLFDMGTLEAYYPSQIIGTQSIKNEIESDNTVSTRINSNSTYITRSPEAQDLLTIFNRDVKDNITNPYGEQKGVIVCQIVQNKKQDTFFRFLTYLSLGSSTLLGIPSGYCRTSINVEVEIYDLSDKLIGRYTADCSKKVWSALYYGYNLNDISRKSNIDAFKCAMNDIKVQINSDATRLNELLNSQITD